MRKTELEAMLCCCRSLVLCERGYLAVIGPKGVTRGRFLFSRKHTPEGERLPFFRGFFFHQLSVTTLLPVQSPGVARMTCTAQGDLPGKEGLGLSHVLGLGPDHALSPTSRISLSLQFFLLPWWKNLLGVPDIPSSSEML